MTVRGTSFSTAVLDANVLYPAPLRDFFMWQAANDVFAARWTEAIHDEWMASLARCGLVETSRVLSEYL